MKPSHLVIFATAILGFGSGFSLLFSSHILLTWMLDAGIRLELLGWIGCLSLPYFSSFTWMPILDYFAHSLGFKRKWFMTVNSLLVSCFMWALSSLSPHQDYFLILLLGFAIALTSATQDHVIEAYRVQVLPKEMFKKAISISMLAFRTALIVSGGGGLVLAKYYSWSTMFQLASGVMVVIALLTAMMPQEEVTACHQDLYQYYQQALVLVHGLRHRTRFVGTLITHRLGIFWLESMLPVLMTKLLGLSMMDVGRLYQWYGFFGLILGSLIVNYQVDMNRLPVMIFRCLLLQLVLYLGFYLLTWSPIMSTLAKILVFCECALQGLLATISSLWLIQKVDKQLPAFSLSLWYGIGGMGRVAIGPLAAWVIAHLGWGNFMIIGMMLSCIPITLIATEQMGEARLLRHGI